MFKLHAGAGYEEPPSKEAEDADDGQDNDVNDDETILHRRRTMRDFPHA